MEVEIERACKRAVGSKISNISFEAGDVCKLVYPDNSFDTVFSHNFLEHIPETSKALQEMYRVLKPCGIIGIRDIDMGGWLYAPYDEIIENHLSNVEASLKNIGIHPCLGRHLGINLKPN